MIREEDISCYWCKESIPYTISTSHWYCWNCKRYTLNAQVGEYYKGHVCGQKQVIDPEHTLVMLKCLSTKPGCNEPLVVLTQEEYKRDLKKGKLRNYLESREFYDSLQDRLQEVRAVVVKRKKVLAERIPMLANRDSDEYKAAFAMFEQVLERKYARRARKKAERREMRLLSGG